MSKLFIGTVLLFTYVSLGADTKCEALANTLSHKNLEVRYMKCLMKKDINDCDSSYCTANAYVDCLEYIYKFQLKVFQLMKKRKCFHQKVSFSKLSDNGIL